MKSLVFLLGPTASGKSGIALQLATQFPKIEIVSIDSAQVYRDMNIGTAKPGAAEQAAVRHHLIDTISPEQQWSVKQYCDAFNAVIDEIETRGNTPLVVGGTMMYVSALIAGLSEIPAAQIEMRNEIAARAFRHGWPALHAELLRVDPVSAARLPPTDAQRISRALEVFYATGKPLSSYHGNRKPLLTTHAPKLILLDSIDRSCLHQRIEKRFDAMIEAGLIEELETLRRRYRLTAEMPSMRSVGYRQAWQMLEGEIDANAMREQGIIATRQLAKRQLTWQRHQFDGFQPVILDSRDPRSVEHLRAAFEATHLHR